jgi:hypothetical protein
MTVTFKAAQLEEWGLPYDGDPDEGVEALEDTIIESSRWSILHELVFRVKDKFYRTTYNVGATEYQDERPWEHDTDVDCEEVHQVEKLVKVWEPVQ